MLTSPVGRVRAVGILEGVSFLLLTCVAMPIKYLSGYPELGKDVVYCVGLVHGILFISYAAVTLAAWSTGALSAKLVGLAALASLLPFGPFVLDHKLKGVEPTQPANSEVRG